MTKPYSSWRIPVQVLIGIAEELERQGVSRGQFLVGTGLSTTILADPSNRISIQKHIELIERAIDLAPTPGIGLDVGKKQTPSSWGILGYAVNCCGTTREALLMGARYSRIASSFNTLQLIETEQMAYWVATPPVDLGRVLPFIMEFEFVSFCRSATLMTGKSDALVEFHCSYPPPPYFKRYGEFFDIPVRFNAKANQILIHPSGLNYPILQASPVNTTMAAQLCEEHLARQPIYDDLAMQVRSMLLAQPGTFPSAESIARSLNMTSRTLRNKLSDADASFQMILDSVREQLARNQLTYTQLKIDDIAWKAGFRDTTSFRRAFKKWTGSTPAEYRIASRSAAKGPQNR